MIGLLGANLGSQIELNLSSACIEAMQPRGGVGGNRHAKPWCLLRSRGENQASEPQVCSQELHEGHNHDLPLAKYKSDDCEHWCRPVDGGGKALKLPWKTGGHSTTKNRSETYCLPGAHSACMYCHAQRECMRRQPISMTAIGKNSETLRKRTVIVVIVSSARATVVCTRQILLFLHEAMCRCAFMK